MYLHNVPSSYGRLVQKPEKISTREDMYDDNVSIQDQIENLRIKISLKERYNKVLRDEMEESRQGASMIIQDLYTETKNLRHKLMDALSAERTAVHNAMRTHRRFQLATQGQLPDRAIPWLDDKLFDMAKRLNFLLYRLYCKRKKLEEVENMVEQMEKWPRPGTQPWEIAATEAFQKIEYDIENMKVKLETTNILHSKYYEIKLILREEKGKYSPVLRALDNQLQNQRKELAQLQNMLADAIVFANDAGKKLTLTEQEASENRRRRKRQMARMKKAVQRILEANQLASTANKGISREKRVSFSESADTRGGVLDENEMIRSKKLELERFQDRTRRIVEAMRVPNLTHIPLRYKTVMELGHRFDQEKKAKEALRDKLLRQQNMLNLILCYFLYNGQKEEIVYQEKKAGMEGQLQEIQKRTLEKRAQLQLYGELLIDVRIALLSIKDRFDDSVKKKRKFNSSDILTQLKIIYVKVSKLVDNVNDLQKSIVEDPEDPKINYHQFIKPTQVQPRLVRVGTPPKQEDSDDDTADFGDIKVPGRVEIKAKSQRFLTQAKLKRGMR